MAERFPKKKMSKSERQAERNRKREFGGLPSEEAPLEGPMQAAFRKNGVKHEDDVLPESSPLDEATPDTTATLEKLEEQATDERMEIARREGPEQALSADIPAQHKIDEQIATIEEQPTLAGSEDISDELRRGERRETSATLPIPGPVREIYGEKPPPHIEEIVKTYVRLPPAKREGYIAHLREEEQAFQGKIQQKRIARQEQRQDQQKKLPHRKKARRPKTISQIDAMRNEGGVAPDLARENQGVTKTSASTQAEVDALATGAEAREPSTGGEYPWGSSPLVSALNHAEERKRLRDEYTERKQALEQVLDSKYPNGVPTSIVEQLDHLDAIFKASARENREADVLPQVLADLQNLTKSESPSKESRWDWKAAKEAAIAETMQEEERELVPETAPAEVIGKSEVEAERKKLRGLVDQLVGKVRKGGEKIKEGTDWWKSSSEHLIRRSKELDAEAEKVGGLENAFRKLGEQYNKLGWKSKLAVGLGLGLGAGISMAAVSLPGIIAFTAGIGAQRAAGLATMYLKYEKAAIEKGKDKESKYWKEKQMAKAMLYTAGMTAGMAYAVKEVSESEFAQRAAEWLKEHWPSGAAGGKGSAASPEYSLSGEEIKVARPPEPMPIPSAPAEVSPTPGVAAEVPTPGVASAEVVPPPIAPEVVPDMPVVEATPGFGYEYMAKRLWEQLQEKGIDPDAFAEGSDIRRLLEADAGSINKVVHELAEKNEFFKPDGTSVRIDVGSTLSFNNEGALTLNGNVSAPEAAPLTPPYPSAPAVGVAAPQMPDYTTEAAAVGAEAPAPVPPAETVSDSVPVHKIKGVPAEHLVSEPMADIPAPSEPPAPLQSPESIPYIPAPEEVPAPPPEPAPEVSGEPPASVPEPVATEHAAGSVINQYGIEVSVSKPHIYADSGAEHLFVYGGSPAERAETIAAYLAENPKGVIFAADDSGTYRIPWHLVDGKPEPGAPMRTSGLFGFFSTWMSPPEPGEFAKIVK